MYAPKVFVCMIGVLLIFSASLWTISGSFVLALFDTFVCAIILQVGYFIGVLVLIAREKPQRAPETSGRGVVEFEQTAEKAIKPSEQGTF
ncbi:exopolysaccharide production repressor protein [Rhizobium sp. BE258]|uniref:exopolysaccharide production repressor protein n=1 Tax=Rhizobium sp. BE258 TaxID=2817722 RepID=UPI002861B827|nr:exopolysaccharide production repressor protein [Rhizobium sp. BE258]MDR7145320.1 exopolysaccharide production repressor protein [Rhizobium sp. BE258]